MSDKKSKPKTKTPSGYVKRGTFLGVTLTVLILFVIVTIFAVIVFFYWRRDRAELQNNIMPVCRATA